MSSALTLALHEAMQRLGAHAQVLPPLLDELRGTVRFGDVSSLVPVPSAARAFAGLQLAGTPGNFFTFEVLFSRDAVVEQVLTTSAQGPFNVSVQTIGTLAPASQVPLLQLGGPNVVSTARIGQAPGLIATGIQLPANLSFSPLQWDLKRGSFLLIQQTVINSIAYAGVVWREFEVVQGPQP